MEELIYRLSDWEISEVNKASGFIDEDVLQNGSRLLTGNGYLGRRGVADEAEASDMPATIIAGFYDRQGDLWREPVNSPDPLYLLAGEVSAGIPLNELSPADFTPFRAGDSNTVFHEQSLNFRYGIYSRKTEWRLPSSGGTLTVCTERYPHMEDVHLLCMRYTLCADTPCRIKIRQGINCAVRDLNGPHLGNFQFKRHREKGLNILELSCTTLEQKIPLAVFSALVPVSGNDSINKTEIPENGEGLFTDYYFDLDGKTEANFIVYGTIYTCLDNIQSLQTLPYPCESKIPGEAAQAQILKAIDEAWASLLNRHKAQWDSIWQSSDVYIEGDDYAQRCLRYSLYQLWTGAPRHSLNGERALSVPARGLSGQTYKGAVFWDTEMFIAPYFLSVKPELAAEFIRYRIQTLPGAKRKAKEYGYRGAFFAWESQETGDDACSDFNVTDVFTGRPVRTYFRDKQIHISADIVYSIKKYIDQTGDCSVLCEGAMELILEAARFYLSYLYYSPERKRYEALDVIGPDEYHERVNNNAFTNKMIIFVFETVLEYIGMFEETDPAFINDLVNHIDFAADLEFLKIALKQFYLPKPGENGIIEQFDGYFRLEDCSLETIRSRLKDPREYWGGGNGVASSAKIIKQADTAAMLVLFGNDYSDEIKKANLDYYEPRTEHGSSLSSCMYALLACETGRPDRAYPFFIKSAEIDITGKSKQFAGLVYIGGTHPAANGGAWMTAVQGFCGFSVAGGEIKIKPRLPEKWKKVKFNVKLHDIEYEITVTGDNYTICKK